MINLLNAISLEKWQVVAIGVSCLLFVVAVLILRYIAYKKSKPEYEVKESLMSETEIQYYNILVALLGESYLIYPQINLATVINKKSPKGFRTELFRNADFGVFDCNFKPILLIEINDNSHFRKDRIERDEHVLEICKNAKLPLVTFWVKDGIDIEQMRKTLKKYLRF